MGEMREIDGIIWNREEVLFQFVSKETSPNPVDSDQALSSASQCEIFCGPGSSHTCIHVQPICPDQGSMAECVVCMSHQDSTIQA